MYKLAIFDMDGTIANSLPDIKAAGDFALAELGFDGYELENYKYFIGSGMDFLLEKMLEGKNAPATDFEKLKTAYFSYYSQHPDDLVCAYEGLKSALEDLKKSGIILAIATNKPQNLAEIIAERLYGENLFSYVFGATNDRNLKPDPQIVYEIIDIAGVKKEETVMVGDLDVDILTGVNAEIDTISVKWGYATPEKLEKIKKLNPTHTINTPSDLRKLIV